MADNPSSGITGEPIVHKGDPGYQYDQPLPNAEPGNRMLPPEPEDKPAVPEDPSEALKGSQFLDKIFGNKDEVPDPTEDEPKTPAKPKTEKEPDPIPPEPGPDPDPDPDPTPEPEPKPTGPTAEDIARAATTAATEAVLNANKEEGEARKTAKRPDLPPEHEDFADLYAELAEMNPKKYGDIFEKLSGFSDKEAEYIERWKAKNPDEDYNPEDASHRSWYAKHELKIDQSDSRKAERQIIKREMWSEFDKEYREELAPIKRQMKVQQLQATVAVEQQKLAREMIQAVVPEQKDFSTEALEKLAENDKVADLTIKETIEPWMNFTASARLIMDEAVKFDRNNPVHSGVASMLGELEQSIASLPPSEQVHGGRRFSDLGSFIEMSPKEQAKHWTVSTDALVEYVGSVAKREIGERKKFWETKAKELGASGANNGKPESKVTRRAAVAASAAASTSAVPPQRGMVDSPGQKAVPDGGLEKFFANVGMT